MPESYRGLQWELLGEHRLPCSAAGPTLPSGSASASKYHHSFALPV